MDPRGSRKRITLHVVEAKLPGSDLVALSTQILVEAVRATVDPVEELPKCLGRAHSSLVSCSGSSDAILAAEAPGESAAQRRRYGAPVARMPLKSAVGPTDTAF
jgi:hypothetical protein